jgi:hypothetical protein
MRPLFRSLLVFSLFAMIASHVSTRALETALTGVSPSALATLDRLLNTLLIHPLGQELSVYMLLGLGAFFALWAYVAGLAAGQSRKQERFSTW